MAYHCNRFVLLEQNGFPSVGDVLCTFIIVRKLPNPTLYAVFINLSIIVTEFGPLFIMRSDGGPCYSSNEFQEFLQCYSIDHQINAPKNYWFC